MSWVFLAAAGILETVWAVCLKYSDGFTHLVPSVLTVLGMAASFVCLSLALKQLPLGSAYAIWTGIGTIGTFAAGIVLFRETANPLQLLCIGLIAAGIVGLRLLAA